MGQTVDVMIEGGKASAGAAMGQALGPLGLNMGEILAAINEKTKDFAGMQVPVKIIVDDDKSFEIEVGTPPVSAMIKKETNLEKLSGKPNTEKLADMKIEQAIKIAKNKLDSINTDIPKSAVKQVIGTCVSAGVLVEGKDPKEVMKEIDEGLYDDKINNWKTEVSEEDMKKLEVERKELAKQAEELHKQQRITAEKIVAEMASSQRHKVVQALEEAEIPHDLINELLPTGGDVEEAKSEEKKEE